MIAEPFRDEGMRWSWSIVAVPIDHLTDMPTMLSKFQNDDGYAIMQIYFGMVTPGGSSMIATPSPPQVVPCHVVVMRKLITEEEYNGGPEPTKH